MLITLPQKLSHKSRYNFKFLHGRTFSNQSRATNLEILGLSEDATPQDVKAAYLRLSKEYHPDVNKSDSASEQFQRIKLAFDQLQADKSRTVTSPSEARLDEEKFSSEFQSWKARQRKTRDFDDWLRKVQSDGRRQRFKQKMSNHDEKFKTNFSETNSDFSNSKQQFYNFKFEEENVENINSHRNDEFYMRYEKNFISRLDYILGVHRRLNQEVNIQDLLNRRRVVALHFFAPFILRLLIRAAVYISLMVLGVSSVLAGIEIYNCLPREPEVREEYKESLQRKRGTLADL
jgi:hypothetical protein